jgi:hypothetical protein
MIAESFVAASWMAPPSTTALNWPLVAEWGVRYHDTPRPQGIVVRTPLGDPRNDHCDRSASQKHGRRQVR